MAGADDETSSRAILLRNRQALRRAKSEDTLAEVLPGPLERGCSYHVISQGDVDSLSFARLVVKQHAPLEWLFVSTWVMAMDDVVEIGGWHFSGQVRRLDFCFGEIFPSQYGDEFIAARRLAEIAGGRAKVAKNHSKVMLFDAGPEWRAVSESSANVNTNPRIEQTTITVDGDLFSFYKEFFDGIVGIKTKC